MRLQLVFSIVLAVLLSSESQLLFAQPNPLTQWTYGNATFTYVSGLMDHTNVGGRPTVY